jgi:hypothetical protein
MQGDNWWVEKFSIAHDTQAAYPRQMSAAGARPGSAPARCWRQRGWSIPARDAVGASAMLWAWSRCPECRDRRWTG